MFATGACRLCDGTLGDDNTCKECGYIFRTDAKDLAREYLYAGRLYEERISESVKTGNGSQRALAAKVKLCARVSVLCGHVDGKTVADWSFLECMRVCLLCDMSGFVDDDAASQAAQWWEDITWRLRAAATDELFAARARL